VRALVVEAEPALAFRTFAKPFEVLFAVVVEHVVLAGNMENLLCFAALENLFERVEFFRFREMREIAGVKDEFFFGFSYFCVFLVLIHAVQDSRREKLFRRE